MNAAQMTLHDFGSPEYLDGAKMQGVLSLGEYPTGETAAYCNLESGKRIVASWNALSVLTTEQIEAGVVQELVETLEVILENCSLQLKDRVFYAEAGCKINVNHLRQKGRAALAKWERK